MGFALISPLAIGYRHILPVLPFVIVVGGGAAQILLPDRQAHSGVLRALRAACWRRPDCVAGGRHAGDLSASPLVLQ